MFKPPTKIIKELYTCDRPDRIKYELSQVVHNVDSIVYRDDYNIWPVDWKAIQVVNMNLFVLPQLYDSNYFNVPTLTIEDLERNEHVIFE